MACSGVWIAPDHFLPGTGRNGCGLTQPKLGLVSVALTLPFSYYLTGAANSIALAGLAIPFALAGSAYAVHRNVLRVAWGLLAALMSILTLLSLSVLFS